MILNEYRFFQYSSLYFQPHLHRKINSILNAYNYDKNKNRTEIMPRQLSDIKKPLQI